MSTLPVAFEKFAFESCEDMEEDLRIGGTGTDFETDPAFSSDSDE